MNQEHPLFQDFDSVSLGNWLAKVVKDLKGKPLDALNHQAGGGMTFSPFHHADEAAAPTGPMLDTPTGDWVIAEDFQVNTHSVEEVNKAILYSLTNGAEAIRLLMNEHLEADGVGRLFQNVEPGFIETHFVFGQKVEAIKVLEAFKQVGVDKKGNVGAFKGSVRLASGGCSVELVEWGTRQLPSFRMWVVESDLTDPVARLTDILKKVMAGFDQIKSDSGDMLAKTIAFQLHISTNYLTEIAGLRALRILWANILKAYQVDPAIHPPVAVQFHPATQDDDPNQNLISATTMAMSAIIGGANRLAVLPGKTDDALYRRMARNLQHILKMESFLDRVADPAAGSYYIEKLTTEICRQVWGRLE